MKLTVLHLSDLHVSEADEHSFRHLSKGLCDDIAILAKDGYRPDIVCLAGDLIDKGANATREYSLAKELFIEPLFHTLGTPQPPLVLIPGNHDVDLTKVEPIIERGIPLKIVDEHSFTAFYKQPEKDNIALAGVRQKLCAYFRFCDSLPNTFRTQKSFFFDTHIIPINGLKIGVAAINSAWRSSTDGSDSGRLIIGEHTVDSAAHALKDCAFKIFLCHHPFEMLAEWDRQPVIRAVARSFDVILNGHVHDSDAQKAQRICGHLLMSTAGCLQPREAFTSYTVLQYDTVTNSACLLFRKWYEQRREFDKDLTKIAGGEIRFDNLRQTQQTTGSLSVSLARSRLQTEPQPVEILSPIHGLDGIDLDEVFVEPILRTTPSFEKDQTKGAEVALPSIINKDNNFIIAGRTESGKSTILRHISSVILKDESHFGQKVPAYIRFGSLPKADYRKVYKVIASVIVDTASHAEQLAIDGNLVILIDDYDDRQDPDYQRKNQVFREFYNRHKGCRYVLSTNEHISQAYQLNLATTASDYGADVFYIAPLKTAKVRQLLSKWSAKQTFDVEAMLKQILYYFQHCQIPVTPQAVTLFLGVLFRRKKDATIKNEAYLIENYLETLLEKRNPEDRDTEMDFRDKEKFLAALAITLFRDGKHAIPANAFEQFKLDYFNELDESIPHHSLFDSFFKNRILTRDEGEVMFHRRFWFHFFLAKAMEQDPATQDEVLKTNAWMKHGKALIYRAGLTRDNIRLLDFVDTELEREINQAFNGVKNIELRDAADQSPITLLKESIVEEIKSKNTDENVDDHRDRALLQYEEDQGKPAQEDAVHLEELISLQSDLLRNSTYIRVADKRRLVAHNVKGYLGMLWTVLNVLAEVVHDRSASELVKLIFKGKQSASTAEKTRYIVDRTERLIHQIVPLSIALHMCDHLGSQKLIKTYDQLRTAASSPTIRLFYSLLIFSQDPAKGLKALEEFIGDESAPSEEFLIYAFVRCHCLENRLDGKVIDRIVNMLDKIRMKYARKMVNVPPMFRDTFHSDVKKELMLKSRQ